MAEGDERNLSRWESFLKPIKGDNVEPQKKLEFGVKIGDLDNRLSGQVSQKLEFEVKTDAWNAETVGFGLKNTDKTDLSTSLSKWQLETFARYVDFTSVVKPLEINEKDQPVARACPFESDEIKRLHRDIHGMFGGQTLESFIIGETQARMVINPLILEVSKKLHIQIKTEQKIKFDYLPTGKLDYYFLSADEPLGCLEAKSPKTLNRHAFVQAVMELLLVQESGERSKSGKAFFCILSDGKRYVLMKVMGNHLYLEHDGVGKDEVIKVRSLEHEEDFRKLIRSICYLIEEAKKNSLTLPGTSKTDSSHY